ncbi:hypothetical protein BGZ97_007061, partial [Linnemannia gamsii]
MYSKHLAALALAALTALSTLTSPVHSLPLSLTKRNNTGTPATIITACTVPNSFAVTFDDGPSIWTHELLDYLARRNVKVTFFVNGLNYNLITEPEIAEVVKRAYRDGHQIASHTWAHADISAPGVDVASQMKM